jgi:glyoxylase-like metal-dependent hydrolase (beta-lactamase superfamily II)
MKSTLNRIAFRLGRLKQSHLARVVLVLSLVGAAVSVSAETDSVRFSYIPVSHAKGAQERMVVEGGSWFTRRSLSHGAILIEHPEGVLLYDTGLGKDIDSQFDENAWWAKALFAYTEVTPVHTQFAAQGFDYHRLKAIIPSHLHWDHASGLTDMPGVPIWIQTAELAAARQGHAPAYLRKQIDAPGLNWVNLELLPEPFMGFERSLDVFGDGRVVLVDLSGHTPGQVGLYLKINAEQRYLFIGDATWTREGVITNQPRPAMVQWLVKVDHDEPGADRRIAALHELSVNDPSLVIVPAHDERVAATLPRFPKFSE